MCRFETVLTFLYLSVCMYVTWLYTKQICNEEKKLNVFKSVSLLDSITIKLHSTTNGCMGTCMYSNENKHE